MPKRRNFTIADLQPVFWKLIVKMKAFLEIRGGPGIFTCSCIWKLEKEINEFMIYKYLMKIPITLKCKEEMCRIPACRFCDSRYSSLSKVFGPTPEILDHVYDIILVDWQILRNRNAEILEISRKCVLFLIHGLLSMQMLSARQVSECMNAAQEQYQVDTSWLIFAAFQWSSDNIFWKSLLL